nr:unnamed protein product [Callosobruchus analis]
MLGLKSQSGLDTDHWAVVGDNGPLFRDTAVTEVHLQTGDGSIRILFASVYLHMTPLKPLRPQR